MKIILIFLSFAFSLTSFANTLVDKETGSTLMAQCIEWEDEDCKYFHISAKVNDRVRTSDIDTLPDTWGDGKEHSYQWAYTDKVNGGQFYSATEAAIVIPGFLFGNSHHPLAITLAVIFVPFGVTVDVIKLPINTTIQIKHKLSVEAVEFLFKDENRSKRISSKLFQRILKRFRLGY